MSHFESVFFREAAGFLGDVPGGCVAANIAWS